MKISYLNFENLDLGGKDPLQLMFPELCQQVA
jgi:hypothetical protein